MISVLIATSEAVPFAKTGGLADVCGALPAELAKLGHKPALILPAYRCTKYCGQPIERTGLQFVVPVGSKTVSGHLLESRLPKTNVPVFLVEQDDYFDRDNLYTDGGKDYPDNCERFVFFCRAVLEAVRLLDLAPDVIHANDWQTGLIPAYLKLLYGKHPQYAPIRTVFSIHNMAYQGVFWHWDMLLTGLDWKHFNWKELEFYGKLNLLKAGLVYSDAITTVSPRYAQEIQTPEFGYGLEGVLQARRNDLYGILNGIDTERWNPETDPLIPTNYSIDTVEQGKAACKAALQAELGLPQLADVPLLGAIGRMVPQKGFDLLAEVASDWVRWSDAQWVVLGSGESSLVGRFKQLCEQFPHKMAARFEFSERLAHRIEAGADIFVMPSRFEPCGLNQMYSQRYGTVPVVHYVGGLADTVVDTTVETLAAGTATGFCFYEPTAQALAGALDRACRSYRNRDVWLQIVRNAMRQDWSWQRSAEKYVEVYKKVLSKGRTDGTT